MSAYRPYRSRHVVHAKPLEKDGGLFDPRTGKRQEGRAGDFLVKDGNTDRIVPREVFTREYEAIDTTPAPATPIPGRWQDYGA